MASFRVRLYVIPLFIAALWLPFQAIAAVAMPFCRHGEAQTVRDVATEHCQMHESQAPAGGQVPDHGFYCDDCGVCHLAASGFMPTPEYTAAVIATGRDFRAEAPLAPASAVPEPPRQPPKRLA